MLSNLGATLGGCGGHCGGETTTVSGEKNLKTLTLWQIGQQRRKCSFLFFFFYPFSPVSFFSLSVPPRRTVAAIEYRYASAAAIKQSGLSIRDAVSGAGRTTNINQVGLSKPGQALPPQRDGATMTDTDDGDFIGIRNVSRTLSDPLTRVCWG